MKPEKLNTDIEVLESRIAPSSTGYEGQPGHQSGGGGGGGNTGYEGIPGNQGG